MVHDNPLDAHIEQILKRKYHNRRSRKRREELIRKEINRLYEVEVNGMNFIAKPRIGSDIKVVSVAAYNLALMTDRIVRLRFNGVEMTMINTRPTQ